jgi:hypothetical protein
MKPWKRWLLTLVALLAVAFAAWLGVTHRSQGSVLARLKARGVPASPQELDRAYLRPPAGENLANVILNAAAAYRPPQDSTNTPYTSRPRGRIARDLPTHPVDPQQVAEWRAALTNNAAVLDLLAGAHGLTRSRYPVNLAAGSGALLPHLNSAKGLAQFFALAALTEAESGRPHEAAECIRHILTVARSLESEPLLISQLVRIAVLGIAADATAASLPRTQVSTEDWQILQTEFTHAIAIHPLRVGLAGEIANTQEFFTGSPAILAGLLSGGLATTPNASTGAKLGALLYVGSGLRQADGTFCLTRLTETLEATDLPYPDALRRSRQIDATIAREAARPGRGLKPISMMLLPALGKGLQRSAECEARVQAAIVGCALERYRLAHGGQLPAALPDLVPTLLPAVPLDPFDGQPLRYQKLPEGYAIYSVGADGQDNQGQGIKVLGTSKMRGEFDLGFTVQRPPNP